MEALPCRSVLHCFARQFVKFAATVSCFHEVISKNYDVFLTFMKDLQTRNGCVFDRTIPDCDFLKISHRLHGKNCNINQF